MQIGVGIMKMNYHHPMPVIVPLTICGPTICHMTFGGNSTSSTIVGSWRAMPAIFLWVVGFRYLGRMVIKLERSTIFGLRRAPLSLEEAGWKMSVEQITMDSCHWTGSLPPSTNLLCASIHRRSVFPRDYNRKYPGAPHL